VTSLPFNVLRYRNEAQNTRSYSVIPFLPTFLRFFPLSSPNIRQQLVDLTHHKIHLFFFQQTR
jgi:hypothetical protein